jgi:hypothetical protein
MEAGNGDLRIGADGPMSRFGVRLCPKISDCYCEFIGPILQ